MRFGCGLGVEVGIQVLSFWQYPTTVQYYYLVCMHVPYVYGAHTGTSR